MEASQGCNDRQQEEEHTLQAFSLSLSGHCHSQVNSSPLGVVGFGQQMKQTFGYRPEKIKYLSLARDNDILSVTR
jgi:hypothetical protein